ncbi:MAG: creatininase family protein [Bryobacteraceae bacterium]|nr:creatininase family protein [Bryobacteraceae bacterium]
MFHRYLCLTMIAAAAAAQDLPVRWDELVASDWKKAIELSKGTCILPIAILEKHGPHAPVGSDLLYAQFIAKAVAKREYAVVFPEYYFGQIYEAKYAEGTIALPPRLISEVLQATLDEIARNGFKKILIYSTHGGNPHWLRFFVQSQLELRRDYVVYYYDPQPDPEWIEKYTKMRKTPLAGDEHGGERETSGLLAMRPELVKLDRAASEDSSDQKRLAHLPNLWTATSWYARFPNHYAGVGGAATAEQGRVLLERSISLLAKTLRAVKDDEVTPKVQKENYDRQLK